MLTFYDKKNLPVRVETGFIYISNLDLVGIEKPPLVGKTYPAGARQRRRQ